ncbi:MAG: GNAT family N-acetyltransferase [Planctomycetaceae bacterium]|nr:GNAT family N-acetyltransferase [Planctomycetaceae bacterium]
MIRQYGDRAELEELVVLIREIWREYYTSLTGAAQVEYMLEKFQSVDAIARQIAEEGYRYYGVIYDGKLAGYYAAKPSDDAVVFLSKFYVAAEFRGRGLGREMLQHLTEAARAAGADAIRLTVNKRNRTVAFYRKLGFVITEEIVVDIGNGFVMDDYVMVKCIKDQGFF